MNKIRIVICGKEYFLNSDDSQEHYDMLSKKTDDRIYELAATSSSMTLQSAAVLTALSAYDDAFVANASLDNLRKQVADYASYATDLRERLEEAEAKIDELGRKLTEHENKAKVEMLKNTIENSLSDRNGNNKQHSEK